MTDFEGADLRGAQFREVDLTDARVEGANLTNVKMSDVWLVNVDIDGMFNGVRINGVDVTAYVSAELARINPERALMEPTDPEGMRAKANATRTPAMKKTQLTAPQVDALVAYLGTLKKP